MSPSADWLSRYPEVGPGLLTPGMDSVRKSNPIADSASMFTQLRAGNLSITSGAFGGVAQAEAERMPFTSARFLLNAEYTASTNNQLFNSLIYSLSSNTSAYASMVYRNSMSLIVHDGTAAVSAFTAQYNEIVRDDTAAGNHDAVSLTHNEYAAINGSAGTITNMYGFLLEASWGGTSTETVTNFYGFNMEDLSSYVGSRITNLWGCFIPAGNNAFGGKVVVGSTTIGTEPFKVDINNSTTSTQLGNFAQAGAGDAGINFAVGSTRSYAIGIDNSDSDKFKISTAAAATADIGVGTLFALYLTGSLPTFELGSGDASVGTAGNFYFNIDTNNSSTVEFYSWTHDAAGSGGAELMRLDESGLLAINPGATTITTIDCVQASTGDSAIRFVVGGTTRSFIAGIDNSDSDIFKISTAPSQSAALGSTDLVSIDTAGQMLIGDTTNANCTVGLTVNQGANDDVIVALKSSDIAHGITTFSETDTYADWRKQHATSGGLQVRGYSAATIGVNYSVFYTTDDTTKSTAGTAPFSVTTALKNGTTVTNPAANANLMTIRSNGSTRFIFDSDGDSHQDVGTAWTNFDDHDDVGLLTALSAGVSREGDPVRRGFLSLLEKHRDTLTRMNLVAFNDDGHHFVNWSRLNMLLIGAIRQQANRLRKLEDAVYGLGHDHDPGCLGATSPSCD